ncbi:hypothetical protein Q3G72_006133 [Acer saccharum]|nr:hypothetical protein Q3G72_006133 [Acer saccharum]
MSQFASFFFLFFSASRTEQSQAMATVYSTPQKRKSERNFPPKRGKIKAKIFETLMKKVVSVASKASGRAAEKNRGEGSDSATATPPPSAYNSEANSDIN